MLRTCAPNADRQVAMRGDNGGFDTHQIWCNRVVRAAPNMVQLRSCQAPPRCAERGPRSPETHASRASGDIGDEPNLERDHEDRMNANEQPQDHPGSKSAHVFTRQHDGSVRLRIRFTPEEASMIEEAAGQTPLLLYIHRVLGDRARYHVRKRGEVEAEAGAVADSDLVEDHSDDALGGSGVTPVRFSRG